MANKAQIDPMGGPVFWTLCVTNLMMGIYDGVIYDSSQTAKEKWEYQRTDDSLPDRFEIKTPPARLIGGALWWQCTVSDPSNGGGKYVCTVGVEQGGNVLCQDAVAGSLDAGSGQVDFIGDQITFE